MGSDFESVYLIIVLLVALIGLVIGLLPTIIAFNKSHPQRGWILLVNVVGGFFGGIGWIAALIWCFIEPNTTVSRYTSTTNSDASSKSHKNTDDISQTSNLASDIEKLHDLAQRGLISQTEFEKKKQQILNI